MKELIPGVYLLSGILGAGIWGANTYLLIDNSLTLVDTGFKGRSTRILKEVRQLGYSPSDITTIIITHHHADHVGSLATLKKVTKAQIMAHPADAPYIDGRLTQPGLPALQWLSKTIVPLRNLWTTTPVAVDVLLNDGDELPVLGGIKVLHTPGHTLGSISLFLPEKRLVIAGDLIAHRFGLRLPSKAFTVDIEQEIRSIEKVSGLDFDVICFGHGSPLVDKARPAVLNFTKIIQNRYRKVR